MPKPAETTTKIKLRSGSASSNDTTVQPNLENLMKSLMSRLEHLENNIQSFMSSQLKEATYFSD